MKRRDCFFLLAAALATVLLGAWLFVRWLCCWKNFRRFLFGFACFATLLALFYAEEDWRGWHAWNKYKSEWEAKGEKFGFKDFVPPPVPDDQNFAMAPIFDATDKLASRKWRNAHRNPHPDNGEWWDTNLVDPLQMEVAGYYLGVGNQPSSGYWAAGTFTDLSAWQNYYRQLSAKTNEFPVPPQPQTPAQDVLSALSKYNSTIEQLREASRRPDSRFPLDYDDENPSEILLPHLADLKRCSQVLQLRALAELQNGQSDKAFDDVKLGLYLANSIRAEPFVISQLVRFAIFQITLQPIYEGLAEHKWSDAQLIGLDSELSKLDFLAGYERSVNGECAMHVKLIAYLEQKRSRFNLINVFSDENGQGDQMNKLSITAMAYLGPKGWFYQNDLLLARMQQQYQSVVDDEQQTVAPERAALADKSVESLTGTTPFNFLTRLLSPFLMNFARKAAYAQASVDLARGAVALERYRLAHGEYPDSLDALVPQFMEEIPHDVIGGGPLHYRLTNDGQFVLYSVGWNQQDDGGVVVLPKLGGVDINKGDWVWRYPLKAE